MHSIRRRSIVYALLGLIVIFAMVWILGGRGDRRAVGPPEQAELEQRATENLEAMQDGLSAGIAEQGRNAAQERLDSPRGQALFSRCAEWIEFLERHPDDAAAAQRDAACERFRRFVDTGEESVPD